MKSFPDPKEICHFPPRNVVFTLRKVSFIMKSPDPKPQPTPTRVNLPAPAVDVIGLATSVYEGLFLALSPRAGTLNGTTSALLKRAAK